VILVIDTSAPKRSVVALIDGERTEELGSERLDFEQLRALVRDRPVTSVAVATGPGSFTGLRVGVSFGLGLAIGLKVPIIPLPTLAIQAARSPEPATAVVDAGRGRCYFLIPGGEPALGEPADVPTSHPLVGNVADHRPFVAAGHRFVPEHELRSIADAAVILLETASEVPYRNLEIEYMQSFSAKKG
jgi:tRNA threonylcarbamoyl adenosine modification protein YeaZ